MGLRLQNPASELGPRHWLLTKDTLAWHIRGKLKEEFPDTDPKSPLLSLSFLINAIEFSPSRAGLDHDIEVRLPTILDVEFEDVDSSGLMKIADDVRKANEGMPERLIQRKVRESIAESRRRLWREEVEQQSTKSEINAAEIESSQPAI